MNLRFRLALEWLGIGLLATVMVIAALLWRGTESFDNLLYDWLMMVDRPDADPGILLITVDEQSLQSLGKWPWDRSLHARLIDRLQSAQPRTITLDILLSEPAPSDARLAKAISGGPAPVFIPLHFSSPGSDGRLFDTILPVATLASAAAAMGHVNILLDEDGLVRRTERCFRPGQSSMPWPHLMDVVHQATEKRYPLVTVKDKPCDTSMPMLVPFSHRGEFTEIPYADVLEGSVPQAALRGKDIIIGATAAGMGDGYPTPNGRGGLLSGIEVMANVLGALRRNDFIMPLPTQWVFGLSLLPLWLLLVGFLRWRPRIVLAMSLFSLIAILATSAALLSARLWFPPGAAILGFLLVYPLWGWRRLQAMSDFMGTELKALEAEGDGAALPLSTGRATDLVERQSEALAGAIGHMRDLRRFVADTLADLPDPMFVTNAQECVTLTNRLLDERLGENITGSKLADILDRLVVPAQRSVVEDYLANADNDAREFVRFSSPPDITFVMRRSGVRSDSGTLHGHIHYLADITALARAEAEREEVLQLLSHDMRAPQSTIIALLDGEIDADVKKRIERNARRTMQLAQDFVEIARMAETRFEGEDVLLADCIREAADGLWPLARERGVNFAFRDSSNGAFVTAEPDILSRAICNLIDNAIKFSPADGTIDITVSRDSSMRSSIVTVTDHGAGIATDILPYLFTRFVTNGESNRQTKGLGLGLTFVKAVIERHGGSISAHNNAKGGASFIVVLPDAPDILTYEGAATP
jgi:CHASE2 domain-containing sensor protein/signal transduction histidine kinase